MRSPYVAIQKKKKKAKVIVMAVEIEVSSGYDSKKKIMKLR